MTFLGMLAITVIISATTTALKRQQKAAAEREKALAEAEREKLRANLLRAVSHDLRTPLTGIIGSSSSFLENYRRTDGRRAHGACGQYQGGFPVAPEHGGKSAHRHADRRQFRGQSKEVAGSGEEVVSEAIQRLKKRLPDIRVRVSMPQDFLMLSMDPTLIEQVLINLLENAVSTPRARAPST